MKKRENVGARFIIAALFASVIALSVFSTPVIVNAQSNLWVTAYYGGWAQGCGYVGNMQADKIDYSAVTHIAHFAILPKADGTLDDLTLCITPQNSASLINLAHAHGKKVLISVGAWDTETAFLGATSDANRTKFINNLINLMVSRGYDGLDIDWEPISPSSTSRYITFITELRNALDKITPRPLLTAAVVWEPSLFSQLKDKFDQINIMTYDLSGEWMKVTWHNAPIYDGGYWFPVAGGPAPSANGLVNTFMGAGIPVNKLGIGIAFYGYEWSGGTGTPTGGVTAPGQSWQTAPSRKVLNYFEIMDTYYQPQYYKWDAAAQAAYLSIDNAGSSSDKFISYDDETACYEKIKYVRDKGLGGVIIFQLGGGWRPNAPVPDSLLQAVKDAVLNPPVQTPPTSPSLVSPSNGATGVSLNPTLSWNTSSGAVSYTLQVSSSPTFSTFIVNQGGIMATSYSINGLLNNTTYYWRVNAVNNAGTSGWSNVWSFKTVDAQATVITNFKGTPISAGVLLTWQTTSEYKNKGFYIQRRLSTTIKWSILGFVAGAGTSTVTKDYSYTDKKIKSGNTYVYRLKQINTDGTYSYSSEVTVTK